MCHLITHGSAKLRKCYSMHNLPKSCNKRMSKRAERKKQREKEKERKKERRKDMQSKSKQSKAESLKINQDLRVCVKGKSPMIWLVFVQYFLHVEAGRTPAPWLPKSLGIQIQPHYPSDLKSQQFQSLRFQLRYLHSFCTGLGAIWLRFHWGAAIPNHAILHRFQIAAISISQFGH